MVSTGYEPKAAAKATPTVIAERSSPYGTPRSQLSREGANFEPITETANQATFLDSVTSDQGARSSIDNAQASQQNIANLLLDASANGTLDQAFSLAQQQTESAERSAALNTEDKAEMDDLKKRLAFLEQKNSQILAAANNQQQLWEQAAKKFELEAREVRDVEVAQAKAHAQSSAQSMISRAMNRLSGQAKSEVKTAEAQIKSEVTSEAQAQLAATANEMRQSVQSQVAWNQHQDRQRFDQAYNETVQEAAEELQTEKHNSDLLRQQLQDTQRLEIGSLRNMEMRFQQEFLQELNQRSSVMENAALRKQLKIEESANQQIMDLQNRLTSTEESSVARSVEMERRVSALSVDSQSELLQYKDALESEFQEKRLKLEADTRRVQEENHKKMEERQSEQETAFSAMQTKGLEEMKSMMEAVMKMKNDLAEQTSAQPSSSSTDVAVDDELRRLMSVQAKKQRLPKELSPKQKGARPTRGRSPSPAPTVVSMADTEDEPTENEEEWYNEDYDYDQAWEGGEEDQDFEPDEEVEAEAESKSLLGSITDCSERSEASKTSSSIDAKKRSSSATPERRVTFNQQQPVKPRSVSIPGGRRFREADTVFCTLGILDSSDLLENVSGDYDMKRLVHIVSFSSFVDIYPFEFRRCLLL